MNIQRVYHEYLMNVEYVGYTISIQCQYRRSRLYYEYQISIEDVGYTMSIE